MTEYRRFQHSGATWFFTVNLAERRGKRLLTDRVDVLRTAFTNVKRKHPFKIDAVVILPDHLHCIWTLPEGTQIFPLAGDSSRRIFPDRLQKVRGFRKVEKTGENAVYGNGDFGST